jgi:acetolactate synthase I/II/III large subunit
MIDIDKPRIDWVAMGKSMGCPSVRVETAGDFYRSMVQSCQEPGPSLIEVCL